MTREQVMQWLFILAAGGMLLSLLGFVVFGIMMIVRQRRLFAHLDKTAPWLHDKLLEADGAEGNGVTIESYLEHGDDSEDEKTKELKANVLSIQNVVKRSLWMFLGFVALLGLAMFTLTKP